MSEIPDLTTTAGIITGLALVAVVFWRKMESDNRTHMDFLNRETVKCEDNYKRLDEKFDAQATWQRETMIGTIEANTLELNAIRRDLRNHDLLPQDAESGMFPMKTPQHLKVKQK